jgi:hypothetical protein
VFQAELRAILLAARYVQSKGWTDKVNIFSDPGISGRDGWSRFSRELSFVKCRARNVSKTGRDDGQTNGHSFLESVVYQFYDGAKIVDL